MNQGIELAASAVERKGQELKQRLEMLHQAKPWEKMAQMRLIASCFFEMNDHQERFNQATIAELGALETSYGAACLELERIKGTGTDQDAARERSPAVPQ